MNRIVLAYCLQNRALADLIDQNLSKIGIPFEHMHDQEEGSYGAFAQQLLQCAEPVLLIVTDNLLKSQACMTDLFAAVQTLHQRNKLVIAVAPGQISQDGGQTYESVVTHFDRMVYALQYMNYWQNNWLDLSTRQLQAEQSSEKQALTALLDSSRKIANEIGELISLFREATYTNWEDLIAQDFKLFFNKFGLDQWHETYVEQNRQTGSSPSVVAAEPAQVPVQTPVSEPVADQTPVEDTGLKSIPVVMGGMLTPVPLEPPVRQPEPAPFTSMDTLIESLPEPELPMLADIPQTEVMDAEPALTAPLQELNKESYSETEIQQAIQDAWLWMDKGHVEQGLELLQLSLDQHPGHTGLQLALEQANARFPSFAAQEKQQEPVEEIQEVPMMQDTERVVQSLDEETRSYTYMGDKAAEKGDYLFAKYCWDRVAELDPQYPGIYRKLALMTHEHLRDYKETTVLYLQNALKENPDDPEVLMAIAEHFHSNGQLSSAEAYYLKAIQLQPALKTRETDLHFSPYASEAAVEIPANPIETPEPAPAEPISAPILVPDPLAPVPKEKVLTVMITGATSGIGRATAELFARHGHRLILTGRRVERLAAVKNELEQAYRSDVLLLPFDVRDQHTVQAVVDGLPEQWQEIDVLLNNAGLAKGLAPIHEGNLDHWETMIDTNVKGLLYVTRAVAPGMVKRRNGHIINIGSSAGKEVYPNGAVYCATKFAVDALTRAMRMDLYTHQIRVSQVSPGHVEETEFAITRFDGDTERANIYEGFQPLKASDVAETIYFMATRPAHVNIQDVYMFSSQQASAMLVDRSGR